MIYVFIIYYALSLVYCGMSYSVLAKINKNLTTSLVMMCIFAPVLAPVFFGIRLTITKGK